MLSARPSLSEYSAEVLRKLLGMNINNMEMPEISRLFEEYDEFKLKIVEYKGDVQHEALKAVLLIFENLIITGL